MKIGIIVAMGKELKLLLPLLENPATVQHENYTFHCGSMGNNTIAVMQCGIGKVNAALGTAALIDYFKPDLIINTGVAGGTGQAGILDVVIGTQVAYHDVWCGPGTVPGHAADCPATFPAHPRCLEITRSFNDPTVKHGLIASGDIFVSRQEETERIISLYPGVLAVDMESAAIAHTCHLKDVPFLSMRVVSDTPGAADNISQYENFWEDAPRHTFTYLKRLLEQL